MINMARGSEQNTIKRIIERYGISFTVEGDEKIYKGMLSAKQPSNRNYLNKNLHRTGGLSDDSFVLIMSSDIQSIEKHSEITANERSYLVKSSDVFYIADLPIYKWAVICPISSERE